MDTTLKKILIVEDDTVQREEIVDDLTDAGYQVAEAANVTQAERAFDSFSPELVLMDIRMMKGIDGVGIASLLRGKNKPFALVFMTAHGKEDYDFKHMKHLKPQDFLRKNAILTPENLINRLEIAWNNYHPSIVSTNTNYNGSSKRVPVIYENYSNRPKEKIRKEIKSSSVLFLLTIKGKKQVNIYTQEGKVYIGTPNLSSYAKKYLSSPNFVRINDKCIVNARKIEEIEHDGEDRYVIIKEREQFKIKALSFCVNRTFRKRGAMEQINKFGRE